MSDTAIEDYGVQITTSMLREFNKAVKAQTHPSDAVRTMIGLEAMSRLLEQYKSDVRTGLGAKS